MNSPTEEKELIWLPKSLVKKIKDLDNPDSFVQQYIEDSKRDIRANFETFDDEILDYKANMIRVKAEFKKAADEYLATNYQIWEARSIARAENRAAFVAYLCAGDPDFATSLEACRALLELRVKVEAATGELRPLIEEFKTLTNLIHQVDGWKIERFLEMLDKIKGHLYGEDRNILEFLIKNYGKKD